VASGIALAVHFATWIASLSHTSVASSTLLVNTAPIFGVILAWLFLGERAPGIVLVAIPIASLGAVLIALGDQATSPGSLFGNILALAGGVSLAAYQVVGRGLRAALPLNAYVLGVWSTSAVCLGAMAVGFGVPLSGFAPRTWWALVALAVVPTIGGHGLANKSLRLLPAPTVGLFLLGEPVGASVLAWLLFGEVPGFWTFLGGAIIIASLGLVLNRSSSDRSELASTRRG
jgi:drug/metabolite transporter (DMT)-like permease